MQNYELYICSKNILYFKGIERHADFAFIMKHMPMIYSFQTAQNVVTFMLKEYINQVSFILNAWNYNTNRNNMSENSFLNVY